MTKKKLRYSELSVRATDAASGAAIVPGRGADAPATGQRPAPPADERPRAPLDLARALERARRAEQGVEEVAEQETVRGRATPLRGNLVIARATPAHAPAAIAWEPPAPTAWAPPVSNLRERARARAGTVELLLFRVACEWFGVELAAVEEAIDLPAVRHVPEMPAAMLGVITVRGALTSVYSPAAALGVALEAGASALVFRRERGRLGLVVDDVDDVHTLDLAHLRDAPAHDAVDGLMLGVLRHGDGLLALIDAETLIGACQSIPQREIA